MRIEEYSAFNGLNMSVVQLTKGFSKNVQDSRNG